MPYDILLVCIPVNVEDGGRRQNSMIKDYNKFLLKWTSAGCLGTDFELK